MSRVGRLVCVLGCLVLAAAEPRIAGLQQFAEQVVQHQRDIAAAAEVEPQASQPAFAVQPGIELPQCPNLRVLSTTGVPEDWHRMSLEQQVAHPINAIALQLAYVSWQDDAKATLGSCLSNLGIDLDSVTTVHNIVLPYMGTMTAVVMRAGTKGVFVSFRGTDFKDPGDVLVDADCQHTEDKGGMFGSKTEMRLHTGFFRAWESVAPAVMPEIWKHLQQTETRKLYVVGHSLGGAMAAVAALRLSYLLRSTQTGADIGGVWLFGCPRVGNEAWSNEYNRRLLDRTLRIANYGDFASRLPMKLQLCPSAAKILSNFEFRHVGRSVLLCPDSATGLTDWRLSANGSEVLDCGPRPDPHDLTLSTHWLGPTMDAWRRAVAAAAASVLSVDASAADPHMASVMCSECSLSFPHDRAKQLNVPVRAGGPVGCCTSASCSVQSAWDAAATLTGGLITRSFNPLSVCSGYLWKTMEPSSKRPRLQQQEPNPTDGLAVMLTDVEEQDGTLLLWGLAADHQTVLLHVTDHHPYFFIPCPHLVSPDSQQLQQEPQAQDLQRLRRALNARLPDELHLQSLQVLQLSPIMFYRPSQPDGVPYIQAHLKPGASAKKAAAAVEKIAAGGITGFSWRQRGTQAYEADVKLIMRFLSDTSLSGGSWLWACPTPSTAPTHVPRGGSTSTPAAAAAAAGLSVGPSQDLDNSSSSQQAGTSGSGGSDVLFDVVPPGSSSRRSSCDIELVCSWRCIHSLTPDAAQLAQQDWQPPALSQLQPLPQSLQSAAAAAAAGDILPLKLVVLDVLLAPADGADRSCNPAVDPVVAIASHVTHTASSSSNQQGSGAAGARPADLSPAGDDVDGKPAAAAAAAPDAAAAGGSPGQTAGSTKVVFLLSSPAAGAALPPELRAEGVSVRLCATERKLLLSWKEWLLQQDPDGLVVFQVRDNLGVLAARFAALQVDGGSAFLSRAAGRFSKALATKSVVQYSVAWVKSQSRMASTSNQETFKAEGMSGRVVYDVLRQVLTGQSLATFSLVDCCQSLLDLTLEIMPAHVIASLHRELAAAAATSPAAAPSGQPQQPHPRRSTPASATATPQAAPAGSTAAHSLISSSSAPSGHSTAADVQESQVPAVRAALRLARYSLARCGAVLGLMHRLASVPESFEMARATGLTLDQVAYNAQMIRTLSLLLRSAHRQGYILGGRQDAIQLVESPYLMHPIEHKTAGLYTTPVATCDFASLYPSLYRAYNLCYTTLVHPDDVSAIGRDQLTISPTGAAFLKPGTRAGILPAILGALMSARAATRATLKGVQQQQKQLAAASGSQQPGGAAVETSHQLAARVAVLDGRQKALKLTANALYGFTGAQASPLQCAAIADSCLAMGAATCRAAVTAINKAVEQQQLGPKAAGAKVIYAQTDSVFVHFPAATPAEAVLLGQQAAQLVTQQLPAPIELKYERVMSPFLLLHVNRYAGRSFETVAAVEAGSGSLLVKGVRAVWRQSAPYIQHTLMGALQRILMQGDVPAAVSFVEGEITRLLTGHVGVWELAMTGGLWRVTGQQLERAAAAAAAADEDEGPKPPGGGAAAAAAGGGGGDAEDVKGPHTNLAVRLSKRDPNKKWLLGERLSYVLLTGSKSQDEAAEDPLTAVKEGMTPNYQLYWQNKLQTPLKEMFSTCLSPEQLRSLLHGPHTQFRASDRATGEVLEPLSSAPHADTPSSSILFAGLDSPAQGSPGAAAAAAAAAGGGGGGKPAVPATPGSSGKKNGRTGGGGGAGGAVGSLPAGGLATPSPGKKVGGSRQQGRMKAFFATTARCLGCKAVLQGQGLFGAPSSSSSGSGSSRQQPQPPPPGVDPGLCPACRQEEGKLEAVYLHTVGEQAGAAASLGAAHSACRRCHSGGQMGAVVCENGECPILYVRYQAERQLRGADKRLLRLEW